MIRKEKETLVQTLTQELKSASSIVLVDYAGLDVKKSQALKSELKKVNARMLVVKNTLFKLAGKAINAPQETLSDEVLSGPTAMVITTEDPIAPLQVLGKFAKENELPKFKVGVIENVFQNTETLVKLSQLPSKEVLVGQALGTIAAPLYGLVGTLQGNLQKLVWILKSKSEMVNS